MKFKASWFAITAATLLSLPGVAHAQLSETTLIPPVIPEGFDRGRNVSVTERQRPDYDPLGVRSGGFIVLPRVDVGAGYTSNAYLSGIDDRSAAIAYVNPSVLARSDWSRHALSFTANGQLRRFLDAPRRSEDSYNLGTLGRLDLGSEYSVTGEAQISSQFETPFSGETNPELVSLSRYRRGFLSLRGQYQAGRVRAIGAVDHTGLSFNDVELPDGTTQNQDNRNRAINRITGQFEYALSPSISFYSQGGVSIIDYSTDLAPGVPNRDSTGVRGIVGISFDLAGFARGVIGAGYMNRNFKSPIYDNVSGFSIETRLEYFPSELTTVTLGVRRVIEDSNIGATNAFFDNRLSLRVDHELLTNLLLNGLAEYASQKYIGIPLKSDVYRVGGGARYFVSRSIGLDGSLVYTKRDGTNSALAPGFDEVRALLGVTLRR